MKRQRATSRAARLAAIAGVMIAGTFLATVAAASPAAAQDPWGPGDVPLLNIDTFIKVAGDLPEQTPLCGGYTDVSFIAQSEQTDFWISDSGETGVVAMTVLDDPTADDPDPDEIDCLGFQSFGPLPAVAVAGFAGSLDTEPGRRYWLSFEEDDGPFYFALTELPDTGERFLLETTQVAEKNHIVELEDRVEYPLSVAGRCAGPIRMSFVATSSQTTLTTDDDEHAIGVFAADVDVPAAADLREVSCAEGDNVGGVYTQALDTIAGQRYWVTLDTDDPSDQAFVVVDADDIGSTDLAQRMELSRVVDLRGFTELYELRPDVGSVDTGDCGVIGARFTAVSSTATFWAESAGGAFAVYEAPVGPSSPEFTGLTELRNCDEPWRAPSAIGSVSARLSTEPGTEYWVAWTGEPAFVFANAIVGSSCCNTDKYFANPLLDNNTLWEDKRVRAQCGDDGVSATVPFYYLKNHGYRDIVVDFTVDGFVVETLRAESYDPTYPNRRAPKYEVLVEVPLSEHQFEVVANGEVLGSWTLEPTCPPSDVTSMPSCPGGLARIDVIIRNPTEQAATYIVEFSHPGRNGDIITIRKSSLVSGLGQGRIAVTGRPSDVGVSMSLYRDGVLEQSYVIDNACDLRTVDYVDVTSSCLAGRGLLRYAISNGSTAFGVWLVDFPGLSTRSTSAPGQSIAFGGISGRSDGDYDMRIRRDGEVIWSGTVTVACES